MAEKRWPSVEIQGLFGECVYSIYLGHDSAHKPDRVNATFYHYRLLSSGTFGSDGSFKNHTP